MPVFIFKEKNKKQKNEWINMKKKGIVNEV